MPIPNTPTRTMPLALPAMLVMLTALCIDAVFAASPPTLSALRLQLPPMKTAAGDDFDAARFRQRNLLIVASSRDSAGASRLWGDAIFEHYGSRITTWDDDSGQDVLVLPVFDISSRMFSWMPRRMIALLVRKLGGDNNVLLDSTGSIRRFANPPSTKDAALILLRKDSIVQSIAVGDCSPANSAALFRALDSDLRKTSPARDSLTRH